MAVFLLFLILVVLIYATGLLPGIMKVISGLFACILLFVAAGLYGWPMVIGGFVAAIALAFFGLWLMHFTPASSVQVSSSNNDIHQQLARFNAEEKRKRDFRDTEKQRIIQGQIDGTDSVGKN